MAYQNDFDEYIKLGEPDKVEKSEAMSNDIVPKNVPVNDADVPVDAPVKRKEEIIVQLLANPHLTAVEMASLFSVTEKTIKRDIAELKEEGKIIRVGSAKTGHWEVVQ